MKVRQFERLLKKLACKSRARLLILWNRGLGDVPLGLYPLLHRIRSFIPNTSVTFLTRPDLEMTFQMLPSISVLSCPHWKRAQPVDMEETLAYHHLRPGDFDLIFEKPDPSRWCTCEIGTLTPKLTWQHEWDELADRFSLADDKRYLGVHIDTETGIYYGYEKNWPKTYAKALFAHIRNTSFQRIPILLFGLRKHDSFDASEVIDLRGKTSVIEMLAIIKTRCCMLLAPDSGVLSLVYYVAADFPLRIVSLWADPRQGVLRQNVLSPNKLLTHKPLIGSGKHPATIFPQEVYHALFRSVSNARPSF